MSTSPNITGPGLYQRRCRVQDGDVVWLRAVLEAYDGLGYLYGDGSGTVLITTTRERAAELDALLEELGREIPLESLTSDPVCK
ncbi:MAG: DUF4911 domain-containing protein [Myxococcales bacterium]|nr:DUF4911 domain-containing protein [Myxococcales bacterium]